MSLTCVECPSSSLVIETQPSPKATALELGNQNEERSTSKLTTWHSRFKLHPHLGASPSGVMSCFQGGNGLLEVKFLYSKWKLAMLPSETITVFTYTINSIKTKDKWQCVNVHKRQKCSSKKWYGCRDEKRTETRCHSEWNNNFLEFCTHSYIPQASHNPTIM